MNDADEYLRREAFHHAESFDRTVVATQMTTHELKPLICVQRRHEEIRELTCIEVFQDLAH
jgi:hypothetical protein